MNVHFGLSFSHWRSETPPWCGAESSGEGGWDQSEIVPLTLPMCVFSVFVVEGGVSASPPVYGLFTNVSCLWIVASCSFCEEDRGREPPIFHHLLVVTILFLFSFPTFLWVI